MAQKEAKAPEMEPTDQQISEHCNKGLVKQIERHVKLPLRSVLADLVL